MRSFDPKSPHHLSHSPQLPGWPHVPLQHWLREQAATSAGPWDLYFSRIFSETWYGARAAGERIRGLALERLYRTWQHPGGPHPDPRQPAAFSSSAVLSVSASLLGLSLNPTILLQRQVSSHHQHESDTSDTNVDEATGQRLPHAWIFTYPPTHQGSRRDPEIAIRTLHTSTRLLEFEIACLLGYYHHEQQRIADPDAPAGSIFLPHDPGITALLHQYAIALLCLPGDCPSSWPCHCNEIRARFNAPPPNHPQPTSALTVDDLRRATRAQRNTEPRFPFHDPNIWTDDERKHGGDPSSPGT